MTCLFRSLLESRALPAAAASIRHAARRESERRRIEVSPELLYGLFIKLFSIQQDQ
jgi:hypothetical protein